MCDAEALSVQGGGGERSDRMAARVTCTSLVFAFGFLCSRDHGNFRE